MADFDDLIPKSSQENPFANPFADVGRPRSPDPWSLGASYYEEPQQAFGSSPAPTGFDNPYISDDIDSTPEQPSSSSISMVEEPSARSTDPLDAHEDEQLTPPAGPFAPLPVVRASTPPIPTASLKQPPRPETVIPTSLVVEQPPVSHVEPVAAASSPLSPSSDEPLENVTLFDSEPSSPVAGPSPASGDRALAHTPSETSTPATPESIPDPGAPATPRAHSPTPLPPAEISRASLEPAPIQERIISPLTTPNFNSVQRSFNDLALGGEAPGWGPAAFGAPLTPAPPLYRPMTFADAVDDDDDDRPLGVARNREAEPKASPDDNLGGAPETLVTQSEQLATPQFAITVGDPQKVGDPIKAHIVYTVSTKTTVPEFKKSSFSVLRRYSDFLWLFDALSNNNPGVVIPPVPEKMPFGRFAEGFIESRRLALNRCIQKIAIHPKLARDPDLRLFLESDSFALDIKHRKADNDRSGLMASIGSSITGPKFYETDEWFDKRKAYLDALESQLKSWIKAIEAVAKQRTEIIASIAEFAEAISVLGSSDLSKQLSSSLNVLADVERQSKEIMEQQSKHDMETVLGTVEEYLRLIASVRLAFASRIKLFYAWKAADAEKTRVRTMHEKTLRQRGMDRQSILPLQREIEMAESKAHDARSEFDDVTRLIKVEVARFEQERLMDFKASLDAFLEGMISRQSEIIDAWERYQQLLLKRSGMNPLSAYSPTNTA